jgi:hypothetical protein
VRERLGRDWLAQSDAADVLAPPSEPPTPELPTGEKPTGDAEGAA